LFNNKIGVIYKLSTLLKEGVSPLADLGVNCVQLQCWQPELLTEANAKEAKRLLDGKIALSSFWAGWSGPAVWNSVDGPLTLGIVPQAYRFQRMQELKKAAEFASWLGVNDMATHLGFIPEQPSYPDYRGVVRAVKWVADCCKEKGIFFNFETGQETPVTLRRLMNDVGNDNLGINLDPANLILYGRGNPVDALDIFKGYIRGVHVKDGDYSTDFIRLGAERVVGEGSVNFPVFLPKLLRQGYRGDLYIEREISGDQQIADIKKTIVYVKEIISSLC
jgi:L-ribulose-5-phosphate 3-epimerase